MINPIWGEPLVEWNLGFITLIPTDFGLIRFLSILVRSWLSVQMAILMVATTQFPDLIHAFEHLKVPRILTARDARSAGLPGTKSGGSIQWRARTTGSMVGQLFLRSYERSDRIYQAMISRGYTGHIRTLNPHQMDQMDWIVLGFSLIILTLVQIVGWVR